MQNEDEETSLLEKSCDYNNQTACFKLGNNILKKADMKTDKSQIKEYIILSIPYFDKACKLGYQVSFDKIQTLEKTF